MNIPIPPPKRIKIHSTIDMETGKILKNYYTNNPIPEGTTFNAECGGLHLKLKLEQHFVSNENLSVVSIVS